MNLQTPKLDDPKEFRRIDRGDGSLAIVSRSMVLRAVELNYKNPNEVMVEADLGHRVASPFAYYEKINSKEPK